jgi:excinuclease UvrABC helicase subunit UvrB
VVKTLEEELINKDASIVSLTQDKEKIEIFSKQYFSTFRDKYVAAITAIKREKNDLQEKLAFLQAKFDKTVDTTRKEERLLLSSMYELGVRIMDKNIQQKN